MKRLNKKQQTKTYQIDSLKCKIHLVCAALAVILLMCLGSDARAYSSTYCSDLGGGSYSCTTTSNDSGEIINTQSDIFTSRPAKKYYDGE